MDNGGIYDKQFVTTAANLKGQSKLYTEISLSPNSFYHSFALGKELKKILGDRVSYTFVEEKEKYSEDQLIAFSGLKTSVDDGKDIDMQKVSISGNNISFKNIDDSLGLLLKRKHDFYFA